MDWLPSPFETNLKFLSELKEDLKTKYFEQHEKAKKASEDFTCSLKNILLKHQKLLNENVELSITNEKLRKIIDYHESNKEVAAIVELPSSAILGASPNCKLQISSKLSVTNKENNFDESPSILQNENINDFPPIYAEDFNSDIDDGSFINHKSPPASTVGSPVKVQNSPILSKRKKSSSKKSNSSVNTSSQSVDSNNDRKVSSANTSSVDKNIDIDQDLSKEFEKEYESEPLKPIENILQSTSPNNQDKSTAYKILNVSKTHYAKTEFLDNCKKSTQTLLSFKKVAPVIDISKVSLDESLGNKNISIINQGNSWNESFYNNSMKNQGSDSILVNMKKLNSPRSDPKESRTSNNQNTSAKDDDCIEVSFIQNERSSKLRNKLILNKKSDVSVKEKSSRSSDEEFSFPTSNNMLEQKTSFKNRPPVVKYEKVFSLEANDPQRSISDETFFSPAEMTNHKNKLTNFDIDLTEFEDDESKPPAKKMLLNSFDIIPGREEKSPDYPYKETVRKKSEKEKLPGWSCINCDKYYGHLPEKEREKRKNMCSKHRGKCEPEHREPDSFWWPLITDTHDSNDSFI